MKRSGLVRSLIRGLGDVLSAFGEADVFVLRFASLTSISALLLMAACDKDPSVTVVAFQVTCPTGTLDVNAPILLTFSAPVSASSVSLASIVVTDSTGLPVPGSLNMTNGTTVRFVPSAPLPFGARLRLRVRTFSRKRTTHHFRSLFACSPRNRRRCSRRGWCCRSRPVHRYSVHRS